MLGILIIQRKRRNLISLYNLIAGKAGFRTLMDIYDKDHILSFRDRIKKYIKDNKMLLLTFQKIHLEK